MPMEASMKETPGFRIEGPFWQVPELGKGIVDFYGYSGNAKMAFRITPENNAPEQASFTTTMTWQMCAEQCAAPETKNFTVTLKRGEGRPSPEAGSLVRGLVGLSTPAWAQGMQSRISQEGKTVVLHLKTSGTPLPDAPAYFFCDQGEINPTVPQTLKNWMIPLTSCPCSSTTLRTASTPTTCRKRTRASHSQAFPASFA